MTLIINRPTETGAAAVHVLVFAVGTYPYLRGGTGRPKYQHHSGMGQLSSPPVAAGYFVDWLIKAFRPCEGQLATVDVLCSAGQTFVDDTGTDVVVQAPTFQNAKDAIRRWKARGDQNETDTLIFYFCGHGVVCGSIDLLLLEDFGSEPDDPFHDGSIDADAFMDGMRACKARNQLYLLDACRTVFDPELAGLGEIRGAAIVSASRHANLAVSKQLCLWAAALGQAAYGIEGGPTVFTAALLDAMKGAAARQHDDDDTKWVVEGEALAEGVNVFVRRTQPPNEQYVNSGRMSAGFPIHALDGLPVVPVRVLCHPAQLGPTVELMCNPGAFKAKGTAGPWHLDLEHGTYSLTATHIESGNSVGSKPFIPYPPLAKIVLGIEG